MKLLITGICGYAGSRFALRLMECVPGIEITGIDNLSRRGSETNIALLKKHGIRVRHGDLRLKSDLRALPEADWVIDCAANPSVLAGITAQSGCTSEQLVEHNLSGTLNLLDYCKEHSAGLVLISTSRVYSIEALARLPLSEGATRFEPDAAAAQSFPAGFSADGIAETFSTTPPLSLYGATKLASEVMALEYGADFNFPVWVNRCGVIGGPGQFGKADQGIFSFWVYSAVLNRPLAYIGFGGSGKQVRDCVLPEDVADLVLLQMKDPRRAGPRIFNVGGGAGGALSLRETTAICESFFGRSLAVLPSSDARPYDIAYYVSDTRRVRETWGWKPSTNGEAIVRDLCRWASENADYIRSWF